MINQFSPLAIFSSAIGLFFALHIGAGFIENKFKLGVKSTTIYFQKKKINKLEKALINCYDIGSKEDKLRKCLLKASDKKFLKERKINKCHKKYGDTK